MNTAIPILPFEDAFNIHKEYQRQYVNMKSFPGQIAFVMEKRQVTKEKLAELTGLPIRRIDTICRPSSEYDYRRKVKRDHVFAVMIALRMDLCFYESALYYCGIKFKQLYKRNWHIRYFLAHCAGDESITVDNCNKILIENGFKPLTDLI